jgi:hypothetical protein
MTDTTPPTPDDGSEDPPGPPPGQPLPPYGQPPGPPPYGQPPGPPPYGQPPGPPPYGQPPGPAGAGPSGVPPYPPQGPYGYGPPGGMPPYGPQGGFGLAPGPVDPLGRPLATWWQRGIAIIVDMIIVSIPSFIVTSILTPGSATTSSGSPHPTGTSLVGELISLAIVLAYFGWLDGGQTGQTVGKRLLGIATRDATTGGPVGTWRAVLRRFIYVILFALFFVPGVLNALSPLWDSRNQAWHDKAAASDVVRVR